MDYKEIIKKTEPEMDKVIQFFENELKKIRTGQASPSLVEDITVDYMGTKLPLKQMGAISSSGPRNLVIQPWDKSSLEMIEKAIFQAGLGLSPIVDKDVIRISTPTLTEEHRESLLRVLAEKTEDAKQTIRHWREQAWKEVQDGFKAGEVREDDKFRGKDELQKLVDKYNEKIEEIRERKNKEIEL
ncbi:ribosome recycling factor [Candidatus Parcubacteria bacterium]|nr:ribosome recycling factor [Candidatus Parcubacteria bacterium]